MPQLLIQPGALELVEGKALAAWPDECCGLLLGRDEGDDATRVGWVEPCVNQSPEPGWRFVISPEALLTAYRWARERGEQVIGTFHSHPAGAAVPSETDRESAWPGASYLIVGLGEEGVRERRGWRFEDARFVEQELVVREFEQDEEVTA